MRSMDDIAIDGHKLAEGVQLNRFGGVRVGKALSLDSGGYFLQAKTK